MRLKFLLVHKFLRSKIVNELSAEPGPLIVKNEALGIIENGMHVVCI